jgi:hypothetical protein
MTGTRSVGNWLLVLAVLAIATTVWAFSAGKRTHPPHAARQPIQPRAIVWDNRVFSSRTALASWLASRGTTYQRWARQHPADAAIVEHVRVSSFTPPTGQAAGTVKQAGAQHGGGVGRSSGTSSLSWAPFVLLVLGAAAMLLAVIPAALAQFPAGYWFNATRRTYVFALGFSISVGVLIAGFHV